MLKAGPSAGLRPARLRLFLGALLLALALPSAVLVWQTQQQLRFESLHQYRALAEELAVRIDAELQRVVSAEEARTQSEYLFLVVAGDPSTSTMVQRSPLAEFPDQATFPGLIGHFQVDADGSFSTPLLPESVIDNAGFGLDQGDLDKRLALRRQLLDVLSRNQLLVDVRVPADNKLLGGLAAQLPAAAGSSSTSVSPSPQADAQMPAKNEAGKRAESRQSDSGSRQQEYPAQAAFDQLNAANAKVAAGYNNQLGRVDELRLGKAFEEAGKKDASAALAQTRVPPSNITARSTRKEQSAIPEAVADKRKLGADASNQVRIFESEVDPFEFGMLASGHGVLFRKVWRDGRRTIQGMLIDRDAFVDGIVANAFRASSLWPMSDLVVAYQQEVLRLLPGQSAGRGLYSARQVQGELLYQTHLSAPLDKLQLLWTIRHLPPGAGARIVNWAGALLLLVLIAGFLALYRLGLRQILLARQQQDFVSAVSHELKTPLTSIRMYAEMLKEGWASDEKKRSYYEFIHDESERLSRLIANVLQLARMERNDLVLERKSTRVGTLIDILQSKVHTQIERAGFSVEYLIDPECIEREVDVDADAFSQILINLTDNAIKFSQAAPEHRIEIGVCVRAAGLLVSVRDYGPGVQKSQMKKIFQLFYRSGNELTRESLGTGIGLALVRQLARAMGGEVDVINREPGAEFQLRLPVR